MKEYKEIFKKHPEWSMTGIGVAIFILAFIPLLMGFEIFGTVLIIIALSLWFVAFIWGLPKLIRSLTE